MNKQNSFGNYKKIRDSYNLEIPEFYNFGFDVIEKRALEDDKTAFIYVVKNDLAVKTDIVIGKRNSGQGNILSNPYTAYDNYKGGAFPSGIVNEVDFMDFSLNYWTWKRLSFYNKIVIEKSNLYGKNNAFKFGFDFRVYQDFNTTENVLHSEYLVKVIKSDHVFSTKELSLNVRLAVGVRKRTLFAIVDGSSNIRWVLVERVTP